MGYRTNFNGATSLASFGSEAVWNGACVVEVSETDKSWPVLEAGGACTHLADM